VRLLRDVPEEQLAIALSDALSDHGIESQVARADHGGFVLWVMDEAHLREAMALVERWVDQGDGPSLDHAARRGRNDRELKARLAARRRERTLRARTKKRVQVLLKPAVLTWGLVGLSIAVALLTDLGSDQARIARLLFADVDTASTRIQLVLFGQKLALLPLPFHEPHRFFTHVLVHFDPLELLFQLIMLRELGRVVEGIHGARLFAAFVLTCALVSGLAEYELGKSAQFSGMSGVVFGLLGLVWVRGRFDRSARYALTRGTVQFMLVWLALGFFNAFQIARWCPLFGLLTGALWAIGMTLFPKRA
jgi:GlpG protein